MFNIFNRRARFVVLSLSALAVFVGVAVASHSWGGYHWERSSNPFNLRLTDNLTTVWESHLSTASSDWSQSRVLDTAVAWGGTNDPRRCKAVAGQVEVCDQKYGFNGWLGVAQIWISGGHITAGTVKLNDSYFNTSTYNKPAWRQLVMCQEIGHTFGLDHQDENFDNPPLGTCMDYSSDPEPNQHPNAHDYEELETIYAHLDGAATGGGKPGKHQPPAMTELDLEGPGQWGRLVKSSNGGRSEIYEADFGEGHKVVTFVTWVDGRARGGR